MKRECNQCLKPLPLTVENFSKIPTNRSGYSNKCKKCTNLNRRILAKKKKELKLQTKKYKSRVKKYEFSYEYRIPLASGKYFKRVGTMKGSSIKDVESQIRKVITKPVTNVIIKPVIKKISGADARFYNGYQKKRITDYPN